MKVTFTLNEHDISTAVSNEMVDQYPEMLENGAHVVLSTEDGEITATVTPRAPTGTKD